MSTVDDLVGDYPKPDTAQPFFDLTSRAFKRNARLVGILVGSLTAGFWGILYDVGWESFASAQFHPLLPLFAYAAMLLSHEGIHALTSKLLEPKQRVYFGGFYRGMLVVRAEGLVKRYVYVAQLLAPFLVLSLLLPAALLPAAGELGWLVVAFAAANAFTSAGDLVISSATVLRAPRNSLVDGCDDELYFVRMKTAMA